MLGVLVGMAAPAMAQPGRATPPAKKDEDPNRFARIILRATNKVLEGEIISETTTTLRFRSSINGIPFETDYQKAEILHIQRGIPATATPSDAPANGEPAAPNVPAFDASVPPGTGGPRQNLYWVDLEGVFGEDISQTPISKAIDDAQRNNADVIVLHLNADFEQNPLEPLPNDAANFDEIFRAESIVPIFTEQIRRKWDKQPRVVFWVRQAMAGAALLPLISPELYFHSEGRLGGLGNLTFMFEGVGDDVVREKQRSLRLGHAEGWAIAGGYDHRLVRAMARYEYVLSVRFVNGKPELFEGYPSNPGEELLTDDGKDANVDGLRERVSGTGNDVLTLTARVAKILGVSKDTVDTRDDLLVAMGIDRTYADVPGRSKQIMKEWSDGLDRTKRRLRDLLEEFGEVRIDEPNNYQNRTRARGQQKRILEEMKRLLRQWGEGLSPRWLAQNGIPDEAQINLRLEQINIEQQKDRR
ncbi:MAG: hypothetical protein SFY69_03665 [Planctomycetota bacterium]|nr:hypothetical protein [Planctomycetota bacterium]